MANSSYGAPFDPGKHPCRRCKSVTEWAWNRIRSAQRCQECGDRFPCRRLCGHVDCAEARQLFNRQRKG